MKSLRSYLSLMIVIALGTGAMLAVRFYLVEPEAQSLACVVNNSGWRCALREAAVFGFLHNVFGWTALLTGIFATVARWRWLAFFAIVAGIGGAVLYTFDLSGAGLLLGALVWIRSDSHAPLTDGSANGEQRA